MDVSLINWVNSFEGVEPTVSALADLSDGVIVHKILREIAPDNFLEGGVKQNVGTNAILKANNIKKLMKDLDTYYRGVFLQNFDVDTVNPTAVAAGQADEVMKLVELVLGCAVQCDDKHRYIQKLMSLDKNDQANLMVLTQRILSRGEASALDKSENSILEAEDGAETGGGGGGEEEDEELRAEMAVLKEKVTELEAANADLHTRLSAANDQAAELSNDLASALAEKARYQTLYNEAVEGGGPQRVESGGAKERVQELEMKVEEQERAMGEMEQQLAQRQSSLQRLQDDLQIKNSEAQDLAAEVGKLKGYKEKLEQAGDLRRVLADKESEAEKLLEQVVELEASVDAYKQQLEEKDRAAEGLRTRLAQAQKRRASTEGGGKGGEGGAELEAQLEALEAQHQQTLLELQTARSELDKARAERDTALGGGEDGEEGVMDYAKGGLTLDDKKKMLELKTQLARLSKENADLRSGALGAMEGAARRDAADSAGEGAEVGGLRAAAVRMESELQVAKEANAKLESDRTALQAEVAELRAKMGVTAGASGQLGEEVQRLRTSQAEAQGALEKMREEVRKAVEERAALLSEKEKLAASNMEMERKVFEAEKKTWEADQKAKAMEDKMAGGTMSKEQADDLLLAENRQLKTDLTEKRKLIARKDEELAELTRMKNELQIAAADSTQATVLQQQIRDMQRREEDKDKANKRRLAAQEREQKLVVSLMYDLGMELHRTKMYQRANLEKPPLLSWLERKRRELNSDSASQ